MVAGALALFGCTNDYDQFDIGSGGEGGAPNDGSVEADRSVIGGQAGRGGQGPGGQAGTAGADARGGGGALPDAPSDMVAQEEAPPANDATDGPSAPDVAEVGSDADASEAGRDVSAEPDAGPPDVSLDVPPDISPDVAQDVSPDVAQERDAAVDVQDASLDVPTDVTDAPPCAAGSKLCGTTCVPTNDPATGCAAASCNPCVFPNASAVCGDGGACAIGTCNSGFLDCDGVAANGCEVVAATNVDNCGQCGRACSTLHTISRRCANGLCMPSCALGFDSCLSPAAPLADDGCERQVTINASCGSCNNDCSVQGVTPASPFSCLVSGSSALCGCVANTSCGGAAGVCTSGQCVCGGATCHVGESCLSVVVDAGTGGGGGGAEAGADAGDDASSDGGVAADVDTDAGGGTVVVDFCACNGASACGPTETCCPAPLGCHDLQTDPSNCGACGRPCMPGFVCVAGVCQCNSNGDCNGGAAGTCTVSTGQCTCGGSVCNRGERCQVGGTCG
jgi:hypothetical protein